ncbi:hypothetical protein K432DRAFT_389754 [Lepidopterella palustris CBS 459.81]|uniref:Uncharacterized protein n=1 Tax=Lepidopterella palustris CBS 459.81 TaxID=1314670 RepID=A0A8E2JIZ7_9PEZI|nr:hypothetical protein K432DRAFT_389754 [Lepidopterella palustris CBS 459.81]
MIHGPTIGGAVVGSGAAIVSGYNGCSGWCGGPPRQVSSDRRRNSIRVLRGIFSAVFGGAASEAVIAVTSGAASAGALSGATTAAMFVGPIGLAIVVPMGTPGTAGSPS